MLHLLGLILLYDLSYVTIGAPALGLLLSTYHKHHNLWRLRPGPAGCLLSNFRCIYLSCCSMYSAAYVFFNHQTTLKIKPTPQPNVSHDWLHATEDLGYANVGELKIRR